ncbi:hypothetical protein MRX96_006148 [Rhipicephalus microplus]
MMAGSRAYGATHGRRGKCHSSPGVDETSVERLSGSGALLPPAAGLLVEQGGAGLPAERCKTHSTQRVFRWKRVAHHAQCSEHEGDEGVPRILGRLGVWGRRRSHRW